MSSRFIVQVVLTKEEKRELAKGAKAHGLSLSAYTRKVVTAARRPAVKRKAARK